VRNPAPFSKKTLGRVVWQWAISINDGYPDVLIINNGEPPLLLHNEGNHKNNWLGLFNWSLLKASGGGGCDYYLASRRR